MADMAFDFDLCKGSYAVPLKKWHWGTLAGLFLGYPGM